MRIVFNAVVIVSTLRRMLLVATFSDLMFSVVPGF